MRPHKCPVCDGTGKVSRPPWVAGDVPSWSDTGTAAAYPCHPCGGSGIVWGPPDVAHVPSAFGPIDDLDDLTSAGTVTVTLPHLLGPWDITNTGGES